jgi:arylsulfatase A-like enzyme
MYKFLFSSSLGFLFLFALIPNMEVTTPNVVLIYMDDMGYGDLGCYGAVDYETPHIDKLATEGMRFTNYVTTQAVCSASRAALLTGCYSNRVGITGALMPTANIGINKDETTMAEMLKSAGYKTAIFGKWHLGHHKEFLPLQHGFDEYFGIPYSNDMWPVNFDGKPAVDTSRKSKFPELKYIQNNDQVESIKTLEDQGNITARLTSKAIDFIQRNKKSPFFLYLPFPMPHVPIYASPKFKGKSKQGLYGDMMMEQDWAIGEIVKALKSNKIDENTLIILTSDNGPWINFGNHAGSTAGLREGKGGTFEGGHRVPCIMNWKNKIPAGVVNNQLCASLDILPTIANVTQAKLPTQKIDGIDMTNMIMGKIKSSPRSEFLYYHRKNALQAVRIDNWKLVFPHPGRSYEKFDPGMNGFPGTVNEYFPFSMSLHDLRRDPGERYDVQLLYPEKVKQLMELADRARQDLGDELTNQEGKNRRNAGKLAQ